MKLYLERRWKKPTYTIGRLYVDGKYFCNTMEPVDRGLSNTSVPGLLTSSEWQRAEKEAKRVKAENKAGTTAIPTGCYKIMLEMSGHFHELRPYFRHVPGFEGIMIHEGNYPKDTHGCILLGENSQKGRVLKSAYHVQQLVALIKKALKEKDEVIIKITNN